MSEQNEDDFLLTGGEVTEASISADKEVKAAVMKFAEVTMNIGEKEAELEALKKELDEADKKLTDMLIERGWTVLPIAGGRKIELKESVYARFPKTDLAAQKWLEDNGGGELLKPTIEIVGHDNDVIEALAAMHAEFERKVDVNTNSLQAFFRRLLGQTKGSVRTIEPEDVPAAFSLYEKKSVVLK